MTGVLEQITALVTAAAAPPEEAPSVRRRRRITVIVVLVLGAVLLGLSLTRTPGDASFYWLTIAMAIVWAGGALLPSQLA